MANDHNNYRARNTGIMPSELNQNLEPEVELENVVDKNFDEILIDVVKQYPHLYNMYLKDYRDSIKKENSLVEVAKILHSDPHVCLTRWTRLRESFSKEKRKRQTESKSGTGASIRQGFVHFENMRFLDKFVKTRSSVTIINRKAIDDSSSEIHRNNRTEDMPNCVERDTTTAEALSPSQPENSNTRTKRSVPSSSPVTTIRPPPSSSPGISSWDNVSVGSYRSTSESSSINDSEETLSSTPSTSGLSDSQLSSASEDLSRKFKKPCRMKGQFNADILSKKKVNENDIKNNELEEAFIELNKADVEHLTSKRNDPQNDTDVSFCNLILSEMKQMDEAEKQAKKQEILQILWRKNNK